MAKYGQNPELRVSCKSFAPRSGGRIVFCICSALALLCDFDIAMRIALSPCALPVRNIGATMAYFALRGIKKDILSSLPVASHGRNLNFIPKLFLGYCFPIYFFFGIPSPTLPKSGVNSRALVSEVRGRTECWLSDGNAGFSLVHDLFETVVERGCPKRPRLCILI